MQGQSDIIAQDPGSCTRFLIQRHELKSHRVLGFFPPLSFPFLLRWSGLNQVPLGGTALLVVSKAIKNAFRGETISIFTYPVLSKMNPSAKILSNKNLDNPANVTNIILQGKREPSAKLDARIF